MVRKFHIDPARLTTVGYGFSRPVASNATEKGRQQNRRVMATIISK
jgi:OOP family OmpA-OmpF porin